jgi:hypothetical protein
MMTTTINLIRKKANGTYQFLTSAFPSYCVMTPSQFAALIEEFKKLLNDEPTARHRPAAMFPDFQSLNKTLRMQMLKDFDGYLLASNVYGDFLCRMTQEQFEKLIKELIELQDLLSCAAKEMEVYFPDFTYKITG